MHNLRKNIRFLRKQRGYSIPAFAEILGLSKYTISAFESGYTGISLPVLIKIKHLFNISLDDLVFKDLTK